jgi:hypothetical protein
MNDQRNIAKALAEQLKEYYRELQMLTKLVAVHGNQKELTIKLLEIPYTTSTVQQKRSVIKAFNDSSEIHHACNEIIEGRMKDIYTSLVTNKHLVQKLNAE